MNLSPRLRPPGINVADVLGAGNPLGICPAFTEHVPHLLWVTVDQDVLHGHVIPLPQLNGPNPGPSINGSG
jgi:hypothetical protein